MINSDNGVEMSNDSLSSELEVAPKEDGEFALTFHLLNQGQNTIGVTYNVPFADFDLRVYAGNKEEVEVVQPAYDSAVQPVTVTIPVGGKVSIETPIRLRFDPQIGPAGGDIPTLWTLYHEPVPVRLKFILYLEGVDVAPCEAYLNPNG